MHSFTLILDHSCNIGLGKTTLTDFTIGFGLGLGGRVGALEDRWNVWLLFGGLGAVLLGMIMTDSIQEAGRNTWQQ